LPPVPRLPIGIIVTHNPTFVNLLLPNSGLFHFKYVSNLANFLAKLLTAVTDYAIIDATLHETHFATALDAPPRNTSSKNKSITLVCDAHNKM